MDRYDWREGEAEVEKAQGEALFSFDDDVPSFSLAAATPTVDPIVDRAEKLAPGAAEEIVAPYREIIARAEKEGVDLTTVLVRVLHHARFEMVGAEQLQDLLAAVMLDATMRGIVDQRKTRRADA